MSASGSGEHGRQLGAAQGHLNPSLGQGQPGEAGSRPVPADSGFTKHTQELLERLQAMALQRARENEADGAGSHDAHRKAKRRKTGSGLRDGDTTSTSGLSRGGGPAAGPDVIISSTSVMPPVRAPGSCSAGGAGGGQGGGGPSSRRLASRVFYDLLVLQDRGYVQLAQHGDDLDIRPRPHMLGAGLLGGRQQ